MKEEGPEHKKVFTVEVRLHSTTLPGATSKSKPEFVARAKASTKKQAEQSAAKQALDYMRTAGCAAEVSDAADSENPASRKGRKVAS